MAHRVIGLLTFLLWAIMSFLTLYVLFTKGPDVLVLVSLVVVACLGAALFGVLNERRGPRG